MAKKKPLHWLAPVLGQDFRKRNLQKSNVGIIPRMEKNYKPPARSRRGFYFPASPISKSRRVWGWPLQQNNPCGIRASHRAPQCTGDDRRDIKSGRGGTSVVVVRPILRGRNVAVDAPAKARVMGALKRRTKPVGRAEGKTCPLSRVESTYRSETSPVSVQPKPRASGFPRSPSPIASFVPKSCGRSPV